MMKTEAVDPVCGMVVDSASPHLVSDYKGKDYHFCDNTCRAAFEQNPERYVKKKGFLVRFLDRLADANRREYGSKGPSCCN